MTERETQQSQHGDILSENEAFLLSQPDVTLYANRSEESQQIFNALEELHLGFRVIPSPRRKVPSTEWGGLRFRGLEGAEHLVRMLKAFESTFIAEAKKTMPDRFKNPDSERAQLVKKLIDRQVDEARTVMQELYAPKKPKK